MLCISFTMCCTSCRRLVPNDPASTTFLTCTILVSSRKKTLHDLSKVLIENVFSSSGIRFLNPGPKVLRLVKRTQL